MRLPRLMFRSGLWWCSDQYSLLKFNNETMVVYRVGNLRGYKTPEEAYDAWLKRKDTNKPFWRKYNILKILKED